MNNWLDILCMLPLLTTLFLAYRYILLKRQGVNLSKMFLQAEADKDLLKKQILQGIEDKRLVESEEFMMFLSKSREDAFAYIEEAQSAVKKFDDDIKKVLSEDGNTVDTLMKILDANKKLQKLLPDNIKNNNVQGEL